MLSDGLASSYASPKVRLDPGRSVEVDEVDWVAVPLVDAADPSCSRERLAVINASR